jgi:hypothetical protein
MSRAMNKAIASGAHRAKRGPAAVDRATRR